MGCYVKNDKNRSRKISDANIHLFIEKGMRGVLVMLQKDIVKQIINIVQIMIKINQKFILIILI